MFPRNILPDTPRVLVVPLVVRPDNLQPVMYVAITNTVMSDPLVTSPMMVIDNPFTNRSDAPLKTSQTSTMSFIFLVTVSVLRIPCRPFTSPETTALPSSTPHVKPSLPSPWLVASGPTLPFSSVTSTTGTFSRVLKVLTGRVSRFYSLTSRRNLF